MPASERVILAAQRRGESDYIFSYWSALGWTILTFGIYGLYVFYQLVRRMRDHNERRLELLDAATTVAWEQAGAQGLQQELAPSFQRAADHLAVLRQMTRDFRDPVIWVLLAVVARGVAEIIEDGRTGVLMQEASAEALAQAAARMLRDTALRERLTRAARETVASRYSADRMIDDTARIFERLIGGAGGK